MTAQKILIIDDEKDLVEALSFRLKADGYETITAHDGKSGIEAAKKSNPDLILLDVMMPGMDGYQVCKLLKSDKRFSKTPIILLTAKEFEKEDSANKDVSANDYVSKPFESAELFSKIKKLLVNK